MSTHKKGAPVRIALVGTGGIAAVHADNVVRMGDRGQIVAATDIDQGRLDAFCAEWKIPGNYSTLTALLDSVTEENPLDIVHLCSPPGLHKDQAIEILLRGINVLSEKPPALSLAELDEITAAEKRGGANFATVSQHRFGGRALWLRDVVENGGFGQLMTGVCHTLWYRADDYFELPWRGKWELEGGGPTMGHGIHQIDTALSLVGDWAQVVAVASRRARKIETEDVSHAIVTLDNGAVISVVNSLLSPRETSYLRFDFEYATVELSHLYGYSDTDWTVTPAPGYEALVEGIVAQGPHGRGSGHSAQFEAIADALDAGETLPVTIGSARKTLELIAAIYESAFTGARISAGEITPDSAFYSSMEGSGATWAKELNVV